VKSDGVYGKDVAVLSMAFEGETVFAGHFIQIMNAYSAFDASNSKTYEIKIEIVG
jgi:hypothetical protein